MHRVACCGKVIGPAVVVLDGDRVADYYLPSGEQAFTEWVGGTAVLEKGADGYVHALLTED